MTHAKRGQPNRVLAIDDDPDIRKLIRTILEREGLDVTVADGGLAGLDAAADHPDLILLDVVMPDIDGFETLRRLRADPDTTAIPVIFVTAVDDPITIYKLFTRGGNDYVGKPIRANELMARVRLHLELERKSYEIREQALEIDGLKQHLLSGELARPEAFAGILTQSPKMIKIFQYLESVAVTSRPVLVTGQTGTGKELFARVIHELSGRPGQIVAVNVAGLDDNLFSDTLFGHEKGAYTGADRSRKGLIEQATDGTLFLDEIGDLGPQSQVKLLRLLQENEYYPLGSDRRKYSNARVVVATNRDLKNSIADGNFRDDLYYRLRTHHIHIPPLKERHGDLALLLDKFVADAAEQLQRPPPECSADLVTALQRHAFPGNVRELEGMVFDAVSRCRSHQLTPDLFFALRDLDHDDDTTDDDRTAALDWGEQLPTIQEVTNQLVEVALERCEGNISRAARTLGISRQALHKRLAREREGEA